MRHLILSLSIILSLSACGSPRSDPFAVMGDASTALDTLSACSAVEGLGCACGAVMVGMWRCAGTTPVCVCTPAMDSGSLADVPFDTPPDASCADGNLYCASVRGCVNPMITRAHCGACDRACASSEMCARGVCMRPDAGVRDVPCTADAASDPFNCGACGRVCETRAPNARAVCREGVCLAVCESRAWWDCNNNPADGCESSDTRRDLCACVCRDVLGTPTP